jgi:NAD(P)-dependent dehydrogenase (short-subunit alcohol dehydrogenase family)
LLIAEPAALWEIAAMGLLDGKVTVVTGAGNGIGRATALAFAREGARVVVGDVGAARDGAGTSHDAADAVVAEIRRAGGEAVACYETVATPEGAKSLIDTAIERFGGLDALVNNAGILRDKTLLKMEPELWDAVIAVHLRGSFLCLRAAALVMKDRGTRGSIVNTTSVSGMLGNFGQANYSAAKAGIYGLTRTASIELQRYGIRVNAVAPVAKTRMTEDLPMFEKIDSSLSPEHVAPAHVYLASDLSKDISGVVLAVAGARMSVYKVVESAGKFKEADGGIWTAREIAEHFEAIDKV